MSGAPLPERDDLLDLERELEHADDEIAQVEAENQELRARSGAAQAAPRDPEVAPAPPRAAGAAAYRGEDPQLRIERALHSKNVALADLQIEQAILKSRMASRSSTRAALGRRVALPLALVLAEVLLVWFLLESVGMVVLSLIVVALGWYLLTALATIKPVRSPKGTPPYGDSS